MRTGAGAIGGSKIEVVELSLEEARNRRFYRVRIKQDGDTEPLFQRLKLTRIPDHRWQ
jgi:hypothetical protein